MLEEGIPEVVQEEIIPTPAVSSLPPVLPPIPRIAERVGDRQEDKKVSRTPPPIQGGPAPRSPVSLTSPNSPVSPISPSINLNPLRLNAVPKLDKLSTERPVLQTQNLSTIAEQPSVTHPNSAPIQTDPVQTPSAQKEDRRRRPISLAYQLDFGQGFVLDDASPLGQGEFLDVSKPSTKASSPSSPTPRSTLPQPTSPRNEVELTKSAKPVSNRTSSPASSYSSFHRSASSSNLTAAESLPMSTSPAATRGVVSVVAAPATFIKSSKPRRSLLNPMSLLKRRKTASSAELLTDMGLANKQLGTATNVPDSYDPRIKGKGVHDFNAPKPRRNQSSNDLEGTPLSTGNASPVDEYKRRESAPWVPPHFETVETASLQERNSEHTPVFFENFEEENDSKADGAAIHRETLANQAFLARVAENNNVSGSDSSISTPQNGIKVEDQSLLQSQTKRSIPAISVTPERSREASPSPEADSALSTREQSAKSKLPTPPGSEMTSELLIPYEHRSSNASRGSRFSFQFADESSTNQELALEEKHKQKAAEKADSRGQIASYDGTSSEEDDEGDSINFDGEEDDGAVFEEPIPGVNTDTEDGRSIGASQFTHLNDVGNTVTRSRTNSQVLPDTSSAWPPSLKNVVEGLPVASMHATLPPDESRNRRQATNESNQSDEMYFDDGLIEEPTTHEPQQFDESFFDRPIQPMGERELGKIPRVGHANMSGDGAPFDEGDRGETGLCFSSDEMSTQTLGKDLDGSTHDLQAYHSALASAAAEAHAAGKFEREGIDDGHILDDYHGGEHDQGVGDALETLNHTGAQLPFDWNDTSATPADWPGYNVMQDEHYLDDDDYEDDPMIAAANEEALAADDSGFYGREFNFYSNGKAGTELYNGGFFRDPTNDGIGRSTSLRDPTLTPITERSEFSRVPSYMSLNTFGNLNAATVAPPLPSPGLKELAARFGLDHDELTLKQLVKLRKETIFAGTAGSSGSSPSSFSSSPVLMKSSLAAPPSGSISSPMLPSQGVEKNVDVDSGITRSNQVAENAKHGQVSPEWTGSGSSSPSSISPGVPQVASVWPAQTANPSHSPRDSFESASSASAANTPVMSTPQHPVTISTPMPMPSMQLMQKFAARPPASSATYAERQAEKRQSAYVLKNTNGVGTDAGAGTDSVAYVREEDGWFMERRRTLGSGEVIVLARELVEGGRI